MADELRSDAPMPVTAPAPSMPTPGQLGVSALMQGSLPPMASGADVYVRQFYSNAAVPRRRFLPINTE